MKKSVLLACMIATSSGLLAQPAAHVPVPVRMAFFNRDSSKCLTISYEDVVMWDTKQKTPLWIKKASDFGNFYNLEFYKGVTADADLTYLLKRNEGIPQRTLINLSTFSKAGYGWDECEFGDDGLIPVIQPSSEKNKAIAYLLDPRTLEKKVLYKDLHDVKFTDNSRTIIELYKQDRNFKKVAFSWYSVKEKDFVKMPKPPKSYYNRQLGYMVNEGEEHIVRYNVGLAHPQKDVVPSIVVTDPAGKKVNTFPLTHNVTLLPNFLLYSRKTHSVTVLEYEYLNGNNQLILSYLNTYNFLTGKLLSTLSLTDASDKSIALANASFNRAKAVAEEQRMKDNLPENQLRQRINMLAWQPYYINQKTHHIFKVQAEKGPYQDNLVSLLAITGLGNVEVFEYIDNLENASLYKGIKAYQTCPACQGNGLIKIYSEKEYDQTLSQNRKIVVTTTHANACKSCGGCGVIPK